MELFDRIPERFFGILASSNKRLYVAALFVLRDCFRIDLQIRRSDLTAMLIAKLDMILSEADFSEDEEEIRMKAEDVSDLSGRVHFLIRKLRDAGWLDIEMDRTSFEEMITVPDYAVDFINLLYDIANEKTREYNGYVYATYAALKNVEETPDYAFAALSAAYKNTARLLDELKTLYNNIRRYNTRVLEKTDVNDILEEHFLNYRQQVYDAFYYPLKTMDSVPRFKNAILQILNGWLLDDDFLERMEEQAKRQKALPEDGEGTETVIGMITYITDTYEGIENVIAQIDEKQAEYTQAAVEKIEYLMNVDASARGKLVRILQNAAKPAVAEAMQEETQLYESRIFGEGSLYSRLPGKKGTGEVPRPIEARPTEREEETVQRFLKGVKKQFTKEKVDRFMDGLFAGRQEVCSEDAVFSSEEDFVLFILATVRGREKSASFRVRFTEDGENTTVSGYSVPKAVFTRK